MLKLLVFWLLIANTANAIAIELTSPVKISTLPAWPAITQLTNYQNKIWFVHSNPYQDTNVANINSYDPQSGLTKFERSLFSQDTGKPVIHNNLLYWPFEDPRRSGGVGEYAVTNGAEWQWRIMQSGNAMHVHALATCNQQLIAVTGSWTGQYLVQQNGTDWMLQHEYPSGKASFSRLVDALQFNKECYIAASSNNDPKIKLLRLNNEKLFPIDSWPVSDRVDGLTTHNNKLYAWTDNNGDRTLHAYDGKNTKTIAIKDGHRVRDLYSHGGTLYVISSKDGGGVLWSIDKQDKLTLLENLPFTPLSITTDNFGHFYIGSYSRSGAALWKLDNKSPQPKELSQPSPDLNKSTTLQKTDFAEQFEILKSLITNPANGANNAKKLRTVLGRPKNLTHPDFANVLMRLLKEPLPDTTVSIFNGRQVNWTDMVHWYLLTGLGINGHGTIDTNYLTRPWTRDENRSSKYFDPTIAAIVATGWIKQADRETINTLINRLITPGNDPAWLQSDIAGALTAITGQRFGSDGAVWLQWAKTSFGK